LDADLHRGGIVGLRFQIVNFKALDRKHPDRMRSDMRVSSVERCEEEWAVRLEASVTGIFFARPYRWSIFSETTTSFCHTVTRMRGL
jgi:hypothetical protein